MIKNTILITCIVVIIACLIKIHKLNNIVNARVMPSKQTLDSYRGICARVVNETLLAEFISYHVSQGFLTFTFYGDGNYSNIDYIYSNKGLDLKFKPIKENVEWDCLLDSVFDPTLSHVAIMNNNEFIFPLESKYDNIYLVDKCNTFEEFNFIDSDDGNLITTNIKREIYTTFKDKNAILVIGKTSDERMRLLRNYSSHTLYNDCTPSKKHGIAKFNKAHIDHFTTDRRLRDLHYKVTLGRR